MPYEYDPQIGKALAPLLEMKKNARPPADIQQRRDEFAAMDAMINANGIPADVHMVEYSTKTADGHDMKLVWYAKKEPSSTPGPCLTYFHGGGFMVGNATSFRSVTSRYVSRTNIPILSVDYRLAPDHPHQTSLVEDSYAGLIWLHEHAAELSVDPARIAVMGFSSGGGVAAGVTLMARDRGLSPRLAKQILIFPMLDDRTPAPDEDLAQLLTWSHFDNITGWSALLGKDAVGGADVPEYAAPARAASVKGLPPLYLDVGSLDLFVNEDVEYANRLRAEKISVELHVIAGAPHGYDMFAPHADVSRLSDQLRLRAMQSF